MPIGIKVDEDLPGEVADLLRGAGHDARTVVQEGLKGSSDDQLWSVVQREQRCLVTADKGFADARVFATGEHRGVILLRLPRESRAGYIRLTELLLANMDVEAAVGSIVVVTPDTIRIHRGQ